MNYIGSKKKLIPFIVEVTKETIKSGLEDKIYCDLFAGTGIVGRAFKPYVNKVISNDFEYYSYVLNRNYIGNVTDIDYSQYLDELNFNTEEIEGKIFEYYCVGSGSQRHYFSDTNGKLIDGMRVKIEHWKEQNSISNDQYFFLLASLLEAADKVANTASVYGAFLKSLKQSAQRRIILEPALFDITNKGNEVYQCDSNDLIKRIEGDILYLDPPYNSRQYGANYHVLNTIAYYDVIIPLGKTGLRPYLKSPYCQADKVAKEFEALISSAKFDYIFLSYNNEGLMNTDTIQEIMSNYGDYKIKKRVYQRFRADKEENRKHKADTTVEYLHILHKS